ncbi:2-amino-4-hydroxy-6-hydroxymethyldihydropteridine diphosphokinase [Actinobacteria bacterium YIM 96077]|uniref:2-amino-4-hydroxy-6-hydroxymethyldihydropteridine diphosphokinase n=1 Tax=Phytoactinopolyspora halophila TaxID=1981511 RepID=A0A329R1R4_9ACTN|nr:2-amino-4-hydroxy-6-hydroxymethyldihydropteridine diphosphokinase [Phytoactinopolyspora halophila]AYY11393.1 2-amino-4-hydroxy-6-hydroxymethyldihydropteridine diphosphokinase [Actinobacteria bacterium YIM 96077]RAW18126.1 2-amino-4-hydroxy-6-hydroxymethyldihydropteridine diphosphokinase [Phytoactinopolyspora halophila]
MSSVPNPNVVDADTLTGDLRPLRRAAFALGSNLGERLDYLQGAVDALTDSPEIVPVAVSPVYETEPVGGPQGQPMFLNAVLVVDTTLSARSLLERAMATEAAYGRTRDEPDSSRTLDVDVLAVGDVTADDDDLQVPHPRLAERAFVLMPWSDVDPEFDVPGLGRVQDLSSALDATGVRRTDDTLELPS